jgi:(p)ppGpp synthase/HD superfamily hydrolase
MFTFTDAVSIACEAHKGQKDKGGHDYLKHPLHLAHKCKSKGLSNETQITAVLHDVVEDSDITFDDLIARGIPESVLDALKLLTHVRDEDFIKRVTVLRVNDGWLETIAVAHAREQEYYRYISRIATNEIAKAVKLEDLTHNSDITRIPPEMFHNDKKLSTRLKKYAYSRQILIGGFWPERGEFDEQ